MNATLNFDSIGAADLLRIARALNPESPAAQLSPPPTLSPILRPRFDVDGDMVRDHSTGLIWTRDHIGDGRMPWSDAEKAAAGCTLGGFSYWRLPTIKELLTLVDYERHDPAIDTDAFKCRSDWYWSSTPWHGSPGGCAWGVFFDYGRASWYHHSGSGFVRAVRVGQF
jgi:hypothetical protein